MAGVKSTRIRMLKEPPQPAGDVTGRTPLNLHGLTYHLCGNETVLAGRCAVVFPQSAYRAVVAHLSEDTAREHGGFLLGYETWSEELRSPIVVVEHAIPAKHTSGTPVRLTFTNESWRELDVISEKIAQTGRVPTRLGWYHSHPNISIFLSHWDLDVCKEFDRRQNPIALVVDPVTRKGGFFVKDAKGYHPHDPQGFLELHDLQQESVVDWTNLERDKDKAIVVSDRQKGGPDNRLVSVPLERQMKELARQLHRESLTNRLTALAVLLVLALGAVAWQVLNRNMARHSVQVQTELGAFEQKVIELEGKLEVQATDNVNPSSSGSAQTDGKVTPLSLSAKASTKPSKSTKPGVAPAKQTKAAKSAGSVTNQGTGDKPTTGPAVSSPSTSGTSGVQQAKPVTASEAGKVVPPAGAAPGAPEPRDTQANSSAPKTDTSKPIGGQSKSADSGSKPSDSAPGRTPPSTKGEGAPDKPPDL